LIPKFTPPSSCPDSVIEPILVLHSSFSSTEQSQIPDVFSPITGKWGIKDLHKTYIDDEHYNAGHGHAYEKFGVDPARGAVVVVRPDQYVAKVLALDDEEGVERFFEQCLLEQRGGVNATRKC
jgi:phenol 2-monooxygenase